MSYSPQTSGGTPGWNDPPANIQASSKMGLNIRRQARPIDPSILGSGTSYDASQLGYRQQLFGSSQEYNQQPSGGPQSNTPYQGYNQQPGLVSQLPQLQPQNQQSFGYIQTAGTEQQLSQSAAAQQFTGLGENVLNQFGQPSFVRQQHVGVSMNQQFGQPSFPKQ